MSATTAPTGKAASTGLSPTIKRLVVAVIAALVLVAVVLSVKVVPAGSTLGQGPAAFNAASYGKKQFPIQQKFIESKATDATTLVAAVDADAAAAGKQYGVSLNGGATILVPVTFTGVIGTVPAAGPTPVQIQGLPVGHAINVQLGPAITGTDLRDATGKIQLGDFQNQIQFQDAATAINDQLKAVLTKAGAPNLSGKTVTVTGVFPLVNPNLWNVTPAMISVQS